MVITCMIYKNIITFFNYISILLISILFNFNIYAGTATSNLTVTSVVNSYCMIQPAAINLGTFSTTNTTLTTQTCVTSTVPYTCTKGAAFTIFAGNGANFANSTRNMATGTSPNYTLAYGLYTDSACANAWGATTATALSGTGTGASATASFSGQIASGQTPNVGTYTDTVVMTINF